MDKILEQYKNRLIQQRYSQNTQAIYCNYFKDFCTFFKNSDLQNINPEQINMYILAIVFGTILVKRNRTLIGRI